MFPNLYIIVYGSNKWFVFYVVQVQPYVLIQGHTKQFTFNTAYGEICIKQYLKHNNAANIKKFTWVTYYNKRTFLKKNIWYLVFGLYNGRTKYSGMIEPIPVKFDRTIVLVKFSKYYLTLLCFWLLKVMMRKFKVKSILLKQNFKGK